MKKEQLYELLGEIDAEAVNAAEHVPKSKPKKHWLGYGLAAAAGIGILCGAGIWLYHSGHTASPVTSENSTEALALEEDDITIYYLDDGKVCTATKHLPCDPKDIFQEWKARNGIGDEVQLIRVRIENNGTERMDESTAQYQAGDRFIMNVTVTENLKAYFKTLPEEQLLDSLKRTLTGFQHIEMNDYNLIYE